MKKKIRVIRKDRQTIVIYSEPVKPKGAPPVMGQKPMPVRHMGRLIYYIMPSGRILKIREGRFWKFLKFIRPQSSFIAV